MKAQGPGAARRLGQLCLRDHRTCSAPRIVVVACVLSHDRAYRLWHSGHISSCCQGTSDSHFPAEVLQAGLLSL